MTPLVDLGPPGPPAHLYVHVPFCSDRCTYCAFATVLDDPRLHGRLVNGLGSELARSGPLATLQTVYLGGGTPSRLAGGHLAQLLASIRAHADVAPDAELTLEANPSDVSPEALRTWADLGVTRISLGVQTFQTTVLQRLGRHHSGDDARKALHVLREWGGSWSADLLVGWAHQTLAAVAADVAELIAASPPHVSVYGLTIEPGTVLAAADARGDVVRTPPALSPDLDDRWSTALIEAGYHRYEISNFALEGFQSVHNRAYWRNADVHALGPGAVSTRGPLRWRNEPDTVRYLDAIEHSRTARISCERLTPGAKLLETLAVGLRTSRGVDTSALDRRFLGWRDRLSDTLDRCVALGLWTLEDGTLRVPDTHRVKVDRLMEELVLSLSGDVYDPFGR